MIDFGMLPIKRLELARIDQVKAGTLLLRSANYWETPVLGLSLEWEGEMHPFALDLWPESNESFSVSHSTPNGGFWLSVDRWSLKVDPNSAYMGSMESPVPGDAFISDGKTGLVARHGYGRTYVSLDGHTLPEPNWASGYVGFRNWTIIFPNEPSESPTVLIERQRTPR